MFDFIPLQQYEPNFHIAILFLVLLLLWQCHVGSVLKKNVATLNATWGVFVTILLILYIGLRPISDAFGDTINYAKGFNEYASSKNPFSISFTSEWAFTNLFNWFAKYSDIHSFFLICAILYVGSLWLACYRIFKNYYYFPLIIFFAMFTFWAYGVNGIRNGIGASLFILAISYANHLPTMLCLAFFSTGFHNSTYLMIGAAILAWYIKNSYLYLTGWIACLFLSYAIGGRIQSLLLSIGFLAENERFAGYLTGSNMAGEIVQMSMAFRWDFVIYSLIGVAVGYYFIFIRYYKDEYYHWIYNIYLTTNAFWLLVIRAAYSNRFAQISWFILPLVLIYPFMKKKFWDNHEKMLGYAIIVFYAFSFYTNILK